MISQLTGVRRLWLLLAIALFGSIIAVTAAAWPKRDAQVVADLQNPQCTSWRSLPEAEIPNMQPSTTDPCAALRNFLFHERVVLGSVEEYDSWRTGAGIRYGLVFLAGWGVFLGLLYALGWSTSTFMKSFMGKRGKPAS
jgi:hypothetical protein